MTSEATKRIDIRQYVPSDYTAFENHERIMTDQASIQTIAETYAQHPAYTATYAGAPVACGGIVIVWKGLGEAWFAKSTFVAEHFPKQMCKLVRETLSNIATQHGLRRIQATVPMDYTEGQRFLEHLGFMIEGYMPLYSSEGKACIRYVMFPKGL